MNEINAGRRSEGRLPGALMKASSAERALEPHLARRQPCATLNHSRVNPPAGLVVLAGLCFLLFLSGCATTKRQTLNPADYSRPARVACVGDSITFGAGVEIRESNCYPAVLSRLLGPKYEVRNLGVSGATLSKKGDLSYWGLPQLAELGRFEPDAIVLKLGTNDTKPQNWQSPEVFRADLEALLDVFASYRSKPKVWLCLPVPVYETRWGINEHTLSNGIIPVIRATAKARSLPLIDLHTVMSGRPDFFPDKIHPNSTGAAMISMAVFVALKGR